MSNDLKISGSADFETKASYDIRIQVTDKEAQNYLPTNCVTVVQIYALPTSINLSASSLNENNAAGATVATLTATDQDSSLSGFADPFTFTLVSGTGSDRKSVV